MKTMKTIVTIIIVTVVVGLGIACVAFTEENTVKMPVSIGEELRQCIDELGLEMPRYKAEVGITPKVEIEDYQPGVVYDAVLYIYADGMAVGGIYARRSELMEDIYGQLMPREYAGNMYDAGSWIWDNIDDDLWEGISCEIHEVTERNYLTD